MGRHSEILFQCGPEFLYEAFVEVSTVRGKAGIPAQVSHALALSPWVKCVAALGLSDLIAKMGVRTHNSWGNCREEVRKAVLNAWLPPRTWPSGH